MRSAHTRCQCVEQLGAGGACARLALRWEGGRQLLLSQTVRENQKGADEAIHSHLR